jgi:DNA invertase Pin-like site-specific DNA recombinase
MSCANTLKLSWSYFVHRDKGYSGAKRLTAMMSDLRWRKIDVVVVWALDRGDR